MTIPDDAILEPSTEEVETVVPTDFTQTNVDDVNPAQFIRIDLVPANVQFRNSDGSNGPFYSAARVIVTDAEAYVFTEGSPDPVRALRSHLIGFTGSNKEGYTASFDDGSIYFRRAEGCACGSRLRGIRPFAYVQHAPLSIF